jgi:hypothetical protein
MQQLSLKAADNLRKKQAARLNGLHGDTKFITKGEKKLNKKSRGKVVQPESNFNPIPFAAALTTKGSSTYVPVTPDRPRILRKAPPPALAPLRHGPMSFEDARNLVLERRAKLLG